MIDGHGKFTTTSIQHEWKASDGESFSFSQWGSEGIPQGVIIAVHGLSGAALDFEPLGRHMAGLGFDTYAPELRGQGNDPKPERRGDLERLDQWYDDLRRFFALIESRHPGMPTFHYGESMGAALLTRFAAHEGAKFQSSGIILASPVVLVPNDPGWWRRTVFHFFQLVTPRRRIDVSKYTERRDENDPAHWVTRDVSHRRWFETAPHRITSFTFRFFKCVFDMFEGCFAAAPKITAPVLVVYAANDVFIKPPQVEAFFARLGSEDKQIQLFADSYHLLLHDFDRASALACIEQWLIKRIPARPI